MKINRGFDCDNKAVYLPMDNHKAIEPGDNNTETSIKLIYLVKCNLTIGSSLDKIYIYLFFGGHNCE